MAFAIRRVEAEAFPSLPTVEAALKRFATSPAELTANLMRFVCSAPPGRGNRQGYQQYLARELEAGFRQWLVADAGGSEAPRRYSPNLGEVADVAVAHPDAAGRLFVEVEFRPNFEKDLVKFQIGWNSGSLAVAVLVVALSRADINAAYTTMPEYAKVLRTVRELRPQYPLYLVGVTGSHNGLTSAGPSCNV